MKKSVQAAILILVIVVAVGFILSYGPREIKPPKEILEKPVAKIDKNTQEIITLPNFEWQKLGRDEIGTVANPKTGDFTMCPIMKCKACGAQIPSPLRPPYGYQGLTDDQVEALYDRILREYLCPKCGKTPFGR